MIFNNVDVAKFGSLCFSGSLEGTQSPSIFKPAGSKKSNVVLTGPGPCSFEYFVDMITRVELGRHLEGDRLSGLPPRVQPMS